MSSTLQTEYCVRHNAWDNASTSKNKWREEMEHHTNSTPLVDDQFDRWSASLFQIGIDWVRHQPALSQHFETSVLAKPLGRRTFHMQGCRPTSTTCKDRGQSRSFGSAAGTKSNFTFASYCLFVPSAPGREAFERYWDPWSRRAVYCIEKTASSLISRSNYNLTLPRGFLVHSLVGLHFGLVEESRLWSVVNIILDWSRLICGQEE